mmetsp:Transcript_40602/g.94894  ORF Transcript_40602/g.94894 Transcript_40602/m.94894 type:complete len:272 (+) Transcript_40602:850-1665(+)
MLTTRGQKPNFVHYRLCLFVRFRVLRDLDGHRIAGRRSGLFLRMTLVHQRRELAKTAAQEASPRNARGAPPNDLSVKHVLLVNVPPQSTASLQDLQKGLHLGCADLEACTEHPELVRAVVEGLQGRHLHALPAGSQADQELHLWDLFRLGPIEGRLHAIELRRGYPSPGHICTQERKAKVHSDGRIFRDDLSVHKLDLIGPAEVLPLGAAGHQALKAFAQGFPSALVALATATRLLLPHQLAGLDLVREVRLHMDMRRVQPHGHDSRTTSS